MALRDAGWIQFYAETNQEAVDLHIQAFRLAEQLSVPVMVCVDGFILTHAFERIDVPSPEQVDAYLPPFEPVQILDPTEPITIGAMVGPEAFAEVRYLAHHKHLRAIDVIPKLSAEFARAFGREAGGLIRPYRTEDAETVVIGLGSVMGTIKETVDEMRDDGVSIGAITIISFRPFPILALRTALEKAKRVIVVEKCFADGLGGIVVGSVRMSLRGLSTPIYTVIAGLGGRPITQASLHRAFGEAVADEIDDPHFLDLDWAVVDRELARSQEKRRSGPIAENILREMGLVGGKPV